MLMQMGAGQCSPAFYRQIHMSGNSPGKASAATEIRLRTPARRPGLLLVSAPQKAAERREIVASAHLRSSL